MSIFRARFALLTALAITMVSVVFGFLSPLLAQDNAPVASLEPARRSLDRIEQALKRDKITAAQLTEQARALAPVREGLRARIAALEPHVAQADSRLKQLGPPPGRDAPAEAPPLAAERARLTSAFQALDAEIKQARLLALRGDQLADEIGDKRYAAYAEELFSRGWSIFDPSFWRATWDAVQADAQIVSGLGATWWRHLRTQTSPWQIAGAVVSLVLVAAAAVFGLRRWRQWVRAAHPSTQLGRAARSLWALIRTAVFEPLMALVVMLILDSYGLLPAAISEIAYFLVVALALGAFGRGVAAALLAPNEPERRLLGGSDRTAASLAGHLNVASRLIVIFSFLDLSHRAVEAPPFMLIFTNALFAVAVIGVMLHLLFDLRETSDRWSEEQTGGRVWYRSLAWIAAAAIGMALVTGHLRLADFLAERVLTSIILAGALYLVAVLSDAFFAEAFTAGTPRGRAVAANLGVQPRRVALVGTLLAGAARVVLLIVAFVVIIVPWAGTTADLAGIVQAFSLTITIGGATISFTAVFAAIALLIAGIIMTRSAQRWIETQLLPRTDLEQSLQLSIGTMFGYAGIILAIVVALAVVGIDLQKIAFIAGALSVGIGFGLQAVVSNFVSGLILLTERPIRVGDWIVAKGEEGYVRRIRVRSTEIETFDRATIIMPNSDLITGVVRNWTHGNTMGRVTIKVGAAYDSDPEAVRKILLDVATENAAVLPGPPPRALLVAFGDNALEFELRCIVRNVEEALLVRSELNLAILARFRSAGIEIPYPTRTLHIARDDIATGPASAEPAAKTA